MNIDYNAIISIAGPIVVATISYLSNKKSRKDLKFELTKMTAELENQKQMHSWQNSMPTTIKYMEIIGVERQGNISNLDSMVEKIKPIIEKETLTKDELINIKGMLSKIKLPNDNENLYPHEIPILINFNRALADIDNLIEICNLNNKVKELN